VDLWIVGMGKLGARELNVSSDIDLIYVYEDDGHTAGGADGQRAVSFHEYFSYVAKRLLRADRRHHRRRLRLPRRPGAAPQRHERARRW
jgi:glutamine synthetase adenylyltransferase